MKPTINVSLVYSGPANDAQPFVSIFESLGPVWRDEKVANWDALPVSCESRKHSGRSMRVVRPFRGVKEVANMP